MKDADFLQPISWTFQDNEKILISKLLSGRVIANLLVADYLARRYNRSSTSLSTLTTPRKNKHLLVILARNFAFCPNNY